MGVRSADDRVHHHDAMVAHQPVDMVDPVGVLVASPVEHADAVGAAVDHVAEVDEAAPALGRFRVAIDF